MSDADQPWLIVVDPQRVFIDGSSPWTTPGFPAIVDPIHRLAELHGERIITTRFVAPEEPRGSWRTYYEQYDFAFAPPDDPLFEVVPALAGLPGHVISEPTFGKWTPALRELTGPTPHLRLAGVATDCCVLSTALAAADGGAHVEVVVDACAGASPEAHQRALDVMAGYAPQIELTTTKALTTARP